MSLGPNHRGSTLIDKIRAELDATETGDEFSEGYRWGLAKALGILRGTSEDEEIRLAEERNT